ADVGPAQIVFWVAFAGFFFGLTYGLLQIVGELAIFKREHRSGLSAGAYVAAKIGVLLPTLAAVTVVLLGVLRALDRLPAAGWDVYASLLVTLLVEAVSALALGLLASECLQRRAGRARPADALFPAGALRRRGCSRCPHGRSRALAQPEPGQPLLVRGTGACARARPVHRDASGHARLRRHLRRNRGLPGAGARRVRRCLRAGHGVGAAPPVPARHARTAMRPGNASAPRPEGVPSELRGVEAALGVERLAGEFEQRRRLGQEATSGGAVSLGPREVCPRLGDRSLPRRALPGRRRPLGLGEPGPRLVQAPSLGTGDRCRPRDHDLAENARERLVQPLHPFIHHHHRGPPGRGRPDERPLDSLPAMARPPP